MKKLLVLACATTVISLTAAAAMADSIKGKIGVTAKAGLLFPSDGDYGPFKNKTDIGGIGGVGVMYGIDNNFAAEAEITRSNFHSDFGTFGVTDLSLGLQYRVMMDQSKVVPFVGAGLDILVSNLNHDRDVDTTVGFHVKGGADYFISRQLAVTAEANLVVAPGADITGPYGKIGNMDPTSLSTTLGVKYFF